MPDLDIADTAAIVKQVYLPGIDLAGLQLGNLSEASTVPVICRNAWLVGSLAAPPSPIPGQLVQAKFLGHLKAGGGMRRPSFVWTHNVDVVKQQPS